MKKSVLTLPLTLTLTLALAAMSGCVATLSPNAFVVSQEQLALRNIETRRYAGLKEEQILAASGNVLQDLGYNLDNSETRLGVISASKERDATNAGQVVGAIVLALLGGGATPIDKDQKIRVSLVVRPQLKLADKPAIKPTAVPAQDAVQSEYLVRITFQRVVRRTDGSFYAETLKDPTLYSAFFERLSKSVFIEGQKI